MAEESEATHISTQVKGTAGYVPSHRQERRLLLRRPPRRARHRPTGHQAPPRPRRPRHHKMGAAKVQSRRSRGCHGPQDDEEPGVGSGGGDDDGAGRAVRRAGEEGPTVNAAVHRGAVDRPEGLPPPAGRVCRRRRGRQELRVGCQGG